MYGEEVDENKLLAITVENDDRYHLASECKVDCGSFKKGSQIN